MTLPAATRPRRVTLQVSDLGRSRSFYRSVLGLREIESQPGAALFGADDDADGGFLELRERRGAAPVPSRGRLGLYHFAVLLPDRASLGRFLDHARKQGVALGAADHLVSEALYLQDPDDLGIEVYRDRPRSEWRVANGEIEMASLPLDARGLLAEAGGAPWEEAPAGTSLGHVHLSVDDLGLARRFYQKGLGLEPTVTSYPGALFMSAGGYHHHLGLNTWAGRDAAVPGADDARLLGWELEVPDPDGAERAAARMEAEGWTVAREPGGWSAADPWGAVLRVRGTASAPGRTPDRSARRGPGGDDPRAA